MYTVIAKTLVPSVLPDDKGVSGCRAFVAKGCEAVSYIGGIPHVGLPLWTGAWIQAGR